MKGFKGKICTKGLWDESIPGIVFDDNGVSSYAKVFEKMLTDYPRGKSGEDKWLSIVEDIKLKGKNKKYDCIIGLSGGTDSSYLLHIAVESGLRPLAVYLDNGWGSNISVSNIKKLIEPLNVDLFTHVIDYQEVIEVLRSYILAELPWVDSPTDLAIKAILYKIASRQGVSTVLIGHDFRSEGFQPNEWTYSDAKQLKFILRKHSSIRLKTFPLMNIWQFGYYSFVKNIKLVRPFFYINYSKKEAKEFLINTYNWEDYGGHHYENLFTKFIITYWLYEKFGIDKRKITYSAQVMSNEISRDEAISRINIKPYDADSVNNDISYLCKKLNFSIEEFKKLLTNYNNRFFYDYPSYFPLYDKYQKIIFYMMKYFLPNKPLMFYQLEDRINEKRK
jgi:N-acetyl sugar amidotransferase